MTQENTTTDDAPNAQPQQQAPSEGVNNGPVQTLRHKGVFIKLWKQEGPNGPFITTTMGKTYKDKATGEFKEGHSFTENDLGKLDFLMHDARKEIILWNDYHRELARQNDLRTQPQQQAPEPAAQAPVMDMTAARDQAMAQAAPQQSAPSHQIKHER
jgi:hypothetical protein